MSVAKKNDPCSICENYEETSPVLEVVYRSNLIGWIIVRDTRTGVQYLRASNGGVCVMVNPDGTPYTGEVD